ncbi:hypothetical protein Tco_1155110, partial [Tanacetum coccineum]
LNYSKNYVGLPTKETIKAALATLGLRSILYSDLIAKLFNTAKGNGDELVATADILESLDASDVAEEVANHPSTAAIKKVTVLNLRGTASSHSQTSLGESGEDKGYPGPNRESVLARSYPISFVHLESAPGNNTLRFLTPDVDPENYRLCKDLQYHAHQSQTLRVAELQSIFRADENVVEEKMDNDFEITFMGTMAFDQVMEEAESNLKSMPNDEIMSIFGDDDKELADSENELSVVDEVVPSVSISQPALVLLIEDVQALAARALWRKKNIPRMKLVNFQALGAMKRMDFLVAHVHNLGKSLKDAFVDKMDSVVPRIVADALEERLPELLTDTQSSTSLVIH